MLQRPLRPLMRRACHLCRWRVVAVLLPKISGFAAPLSAETLRARLLNPFDGYPEICGFPLIVAPTPHVAQAVESPPGRPAIVVDPTLLEEAEKPRFVFFVAHECGHHVLGHVTPEGISRRAASTRAVRDQEMSADCWAAETLARLGQERPIRIMSDRFHRSGLYSPGAGYPAGIQRSTIIRQCAAVGRESASTGAGKRLRTQGRVTAD